MYTEGNVRCAMKSRLVRDRPKAAPKKGSRGRQAPPSVFEMLKDFAGALKDGPSDLAKNHDHYAHGAPKRKT